MVTGNLYAIQFVGTHRATQDLTFGFSFNVGVDLETEAAWSGFFYGVKRVRKVVHVKAWLDLYVDQYEASKTNQSFHTYISKQYIN